MNRTARVTVTVWALAVIFATIAAAQTQPKVLYKCDFSQGLPAKWGKGELVKEGLPEGSMGAVTSGKDAQGVIQNINSNIEWTKGHFTIEDGLYFNFHAKMSNPQWFLVFLQIKSPGMASDTVNYLGRPEGFSADWKTYSIPLNDFKAVTGDKKDTAPPNGKICSLYFFDVQKRDLGLTIDRVWISKGKPAE